MLRLAHGIEKITFTPLVEPERLGRQDDALVLRGGSRKVEMCPSAGTKHVAGEVIFMLPLLDKDDCALLFVVKPAEQRVGAPIQQCVSRRFGISVISFQGVIDDDEIAALAGEGAAGRQGRAKAALGSKKLT